MATCETLIAIVEDIKIEAFSLYEPIKTKGDQVKLHKRLCNVIRLHMKGIQLRKDSIFLQKKEFFLQISNFSLQICQWVLRHLRVLHFGMFSLVPFDNLQHSSDGRHGIGLFTFKSILIQFYILFYQILFFLSNSRIIWTTPSNWFVHWLLYFGHFSPYSSSVKLANMWPANSMQLTKHFAKLVGINSQLKRNECCPPP